MPETNENATGTTRPDWAVMAYLAGDNELADEMVRALEQIKRRHDPQRPIAVQFDPSGLGIPTQRYFFSDRRADLEDYEVQLPSTELLNESNTGNPAALSGFIHWALTETQSQIGGGFSPGEARNLALVLSGHGSGVTEEVFLRDYSPEDALSIEELDWALTNARLLVHLASPPRSCPPAELKGALDEVHAEWRERVDPGKIPYDELPGSKLAVLGLDACFMNMAEVCYQIRHHASYLVGAQGFEPAFGWPYHQILRKAETIGRNMLGPAALAKTIVKEYVDYYSDFDKTAGASVDLAAIRLTEMDRLVEPLKFLARELKNSLRYPGRRDAIVLAHLEAQSYKFDQYVDLWDLCRCLQERLASRADIVEACEAVAEGVEECVLVSRCSGYAYQHSHGLSIYFPWVDVADEYRHFELARLTGWGEFLEKYVEETRRPRRRGFQARDDAGRNEWTQGCARCLDEIEGPGHRYGRRVTKYGRRVTKYGRRVTKFAGDRRHSVKNFPLVHGSAVWP